MSQITFKYKMPYFIGGSVWDADLDYKRFFTVDYNMSSYVGIVGDGIIRGWEIKDSGGLNIEISAGTGMIDGLFAESPFIGGLKSTIDSTYSFASIFEPKDGLLNYDGLSNFVTMMRNEYPSYNPLVSVDDEDDLYSDNGISLPDFPINFDDFEDYIESVRVFEPTYDINTTFSDDLIKARKPTSIVLGDNVDYYIYAKRVSSNILPSANDLQELIDVAGCRPDIADFPSPEEYDSAIDLFLTKMVDVNNYNWFSEEENRTSEVEFIISTSPIPSSSHLLIGKVMTRGGTIDEISIDGVEYLSGLGSKIYRTAITAMKNNFHYGEPTKINLNSHKYELLLGKSNNGSENTYYIQSNNYTSKNNFHAHRYIVDKNGNGITTYVLGESTPHFHVVSNFIVMSSDNHTHTIPNEYPEYSTYEIYRDDVSIYNNVTNATLNVLENFTNSKITIKSDDLYEQKFFYYIALDGKNIYYNYDDFSFIGLMTNLEALGVNFTPSVSKELFSIFVNSNIGEKLLDLSKYFGTSISIKLVAPYIRNTIYLKNLNLSEVSGVLPDKYILAIDASKFISGKIDAEILPPLFGKKIYRELMSPESLNVVTKDFYSFNIIPTFADFSNGHRHKVSVENGDGETYSFNLGDKDSFYSKDYHIHEISNYTLAESNSHTHKLLNVLKTNQKYVYSVIENSGNLYISTSCGLIYKPQLPIYAVYIKGETFYTWGDDLYSIMVSLVNRYNSYYDNSFYFNESFLLNKDVISSRLSSYGVIQYLNITNSEKEVETTKITIERKEWIYLYDKGLVFDSLIFTKPINGEFSNPDVDTTNLYILGSNKIIQKPVGSFYNYYGDNLDFSSSREVGELNSGLFIDMFVDSNQTMWVLSPNKIQYKTPYDLSLVSCDFKEADLFGYSNIIEVLPNEVWVGSGDTLYKFISGVFEPQFTFDSKIDSIKIDHFNITTTVSSGHSHSVVIDRSNNGVTSTDGSPLHNHEVLNKVLVQEEGHTHTLLFDIYVSTRNKIYKSSDNGVSFTEIIDLNDGALWCWIPVDEKILYSYKGAIYIYDGVTHDVVVDIPAYSFTYRNQNEIFVGGKNAVFLYNVTNDIISDYFSDYGKGDSFVIGDNGGYLPFYYDNNNMSFVFKEKQDISGIKFYHNVERYWFDKWEKSKKETIYSNGELIGGYAIEPEVGCVDLSKTYSISPVINGSNYIDCLDSLFKIAVGDFVSLSSNGRTIDTPNSYLSYLQRVPDKNVFKVMSIIGKRIYLDRFIVGEVDGFIFVSVVRDYSDLTITLDGPEIGVFKNMGVITHDQIDDTISLCKTGLSKSLSDSFNSNLLSVARRFEKEELVAPNMSQVKHYIFDYSEDVLDSNYYGNHFDIKLTEMYSSSLYSGGRGGVFNGDILKVLKGYGFFDGYIFVLTNNILWYNSVDSMTGNWKISYDTEGEFSLRDILVYGRQLFMATSIGAYFAAESQEDIDCELIGDVVLDVSDICLNFDINSSTLSWYQSSSPLLRYDIRGITYRYKESMDNEIVPSQNLLFSYSSTTKQTTITGPSSVFANFKIGHDVIINFGVTSQLRTIVSKNTSSTTIAVSGDLGVSGVNSASIIQSSYWGVFNDGYNTFTQNYNPIIFYGNKIVVYSENLLQSSIIYLLNGSVVDNSFYVSNIESFYNGRLSAIISKGESYGILFSTDNGLTWKEFFSTLENSLVKISTLDYNGYRTNINIESYYPKNYLIGENLVVGGEKYPILYNRDNVITIDGTINSDVDSVNITSTNVFKMSNYKDKTLCISKGSVYSDDSTLTGNDISLFSYGSENLFSINRINDVGEIVGWINKYDGENNLYYIRPSFTAISLSHVTKIKNSSGTIFQITSITNYPAEGYYGVVSKEDISPSLGQNITLMGELDRIYLNKTVAYLTGTTYYIERNKKPSLLDVKRIGERFIDVVSVSSLDKAKHKIFIYFADETFAVDIARPSPNRVYDHTIKSFYWERIIEIDGVTNTIKCEVEKNEKSKIYFKISDIEKISYIDFVFEGMFYLNGIIFNKIMSTYNKTSYSLGHTHDISLIGKEYLIKVDSYVDNTTTLKFNFVDSGWESESLLISNPEIIIGESIYIEHVTNGTQFKLKVDSFNGTSITCVYDKVFAASELNINEYNLYIDLRLYGKTTSITIKDLRIINARLEYGVGIGEDFITLSSTTAISIGDRVILTGAEGFKEEFMVVNKDVSKIYLDVSANYSYAQYSSFYEILTSVGSHPHTHIIRDGAVEYISVTSLATLGYPQNHAHYLGGIYGSITDMIETPSGFVLCGDEGVVKSFSYEDYSIGTYLDVTAESVGNPQNLYYNDELWLGTTKGFVIKQS